ncbi:MAG: XRE family transcriptional regulator [Phycisphaerales bacterium]|nr:XRE family transcriptional regulator [Phycisphaerales bacterium]
MGLDADNMEIAPASPRIEPTNRFNPDMLTTAREAFFLTQKELAERLGITQPLVGRWETGSSTPDSDQIRSLSKALGVRHDLFFVDRPKKLASMSDYYHRALARASRKDVKAVHARCNLLDIQIDRLLRLADAPDDQIPSLSTKDTNKTPEQIAGIARMEMGVGPGPILNLVAVIESCGGIVIDRDLEVGEVDALCRWVPGLPKLFFLNGAKPADRVRFSLAHELGHTVMHFGRTVDVKVAEQEANEFAAAFLMPADEIRRDFRSTVTLADLAAIKRKWRVAMQAALRRARTINRIDEQRYKWLNIQIAKNGWKKSEPIQIEGETPTTLTRLLHMHTEAGFSKSDLADLLFVSEQTIDRMLSETYAPTFDENGVRLRIVRD